MIDTAAANYAQNGIVVYIAIDPWFWAQYFHRKIVTILAYYSQEFDVTEAYIL